MASLIILMASMAGYA